MCFLLQSKSYNVLNFVSCLLGGLYLAHGMLNISRICNGWGVLYLAGLQATTPTNVGTGNLKTMKGQAEEAKKESKDAPSTLQVIGDNSAGIYLSSLVDGVFAAVSASEA